MTCIRTMAVSAMKLKEKDTSELPGSDDIKHAKGVHTLTARLLCAMGVGVFSRAKTDKNNKTLDPLVHDHGPGVPHVQA